MLILSLLLEDNGPGISSDFDIKKAKSLGLTFGK